MKIEVGETSNCRIEKANVSDKKTVFETRVEKRTREGDSPVCKH